MIGISAVQARRTNRRSERLRSAMANDEPIAVPFTYVGFDEAPIAFANAFLVQHDADEFLLTVAQVAPPPIVATSEEEARTQIGAIPFVPVKVLARYGLTRRRMVELIDALQQNLANHDRQFGPDKSNGGTTR